MQAMLAHRDGCHAHGHLNLRSLVGRARQDGIQPDTLDANSHNDSFYELVKTHPLSGMGLALIG